MKKLTLSFYLLITSLLINAQTFYNTTGGAIADDNSYTAFPINVSGLQNTINTTTFGIEKITVNINHPADGEIRFKLQAPDGTLMVLSSFVGGTDSNYVNTIFNDTSSNSITNGSAPFTGIYHSVDALALANNAQDPNGTWYVNVRDDSPGNVGTLISWDITFSNQPAGHVNFTSSNIPLVIINTHQQTIPYGTKITADMGIIDNGPIIRNHLSDAINGYKGKIGIDVRGQSSTGFDQLQYSIETRDNAGNNLDTSIFGMPKENDWVLYAPYDDKMLMRNVLTYKLARDMGQWAARTRFCEVFIDSVYQGVYVFMEHIKRDSGRVDIKKMTSNDIAGDALTGGYIFSIDKGTPNWYSPYSPNNSTGGQTIGFQYIYPKPTDIVSQQQTYIQNYVDSFEQALNSVNYQDPLTGYRKYASVKSFVDYFIINEVSHNVDGYRLSTYLHKDRYSKGGQLKAGPVWDYNIAWRNADYDDGSRYDSWAYNFNSVDPTDAHQIPFWWDKLVTDSAFKNRTYCRWQELRATILDTVTLFHSIDSMANEVNEAKDRHFKRFPILGTYVWPNPNPLANTYAEEIRNTKDWIVQRLQWMDSNIIGSGPCAAHTTSINKITENIFSELYPNPVKDKFTLSVDFVKEGSYKIELLDAQGKSISVLADTHFSEAQHTFDFNMQNYALQKGLYLIRISGNAINKTIRFIKAE